MPNLSIYRTTDGVVGTSGVPVTVTSVVLTAGSDQATVALCNGTDNSDPRIQLKAATNSTITHTFNRGIVFPAGCYADLSGTGPLLTVEIED